MPNAFPISTTFYAYDKASKSHYDTYIAYLKIAMGKLLKHTYTEQGKLHTQLFWWCPGCNTYHVVSTEKHTWNGSMSNPTFSPSLLCQGPTHNPPLCHSYIEDGRIRYLSDCEHKFKGQTINLPDFPDGILEWIPRDHT